ncbi:marine proteobacterial sortase target protein [Mangrovitalea sediminis]|uniref:marine proteobacterial sortase target protein n=1 Tax=Mangrovitalea sediminis TaxID=1982043 RepID=UPI001D0D0190|nr:marine proteobacterial sortase target protein [Mangrovitalea sediminis]
MIIRLGQGQRLRGDSRHRLSNNADWWLRRLEDVSLVLAFLLFCVVQSALADTLDDAGTGQLMLHGKGSHQYQPADLLNTHYDVQVSGLLADTTLKQQFKNTTRDWREAVYVFPLPPDAAVYHLILHVGDRIIEGKVATREKARRQYSEARSGGHSAVLVEQQRPNLFTTSVANIAPGQRVTVELRYQQRVEYRDGTFSLSMPLTLTPRYMPGTTLPEDTANVQWQDGWARPTGQVPDADRISPYTIPGNQLPDQDHRATLRVELDSGFPIASVTSPSHQLETQYHGNQVTVTPQDDPVSMDRDFVLHWRPALGVSPAAAVFHENWAGDDYLLLMLLPGTQSAVHSLPRETELVIDTSGSMGGESLRQAKAAVSRALDSLRPQDRFNIIAFNSTTSSLYDRSQPVTPETLAAGHRFVDGLRAEGGTEMASALIRALEPPATEGWLRQVVFLTDGAVGNEQALFGLIHQHLGDARLFTVGIGSAPNRYFMRKAARFGRGTYTAISSEQRVAQKMDRLFRKLRAPVLSHLTLDWPAAEAESYPARPGDLYLGEPLVIVVKGEPATGILTLSGRQEESGGGATWAQTLDLSRAAPATGIHRYWARQKIDGLLDEMAMGADAGPIREEVTQVALRHQLVSPWTSFVAVDQEPVRPADETLAGDSVATVLPAGSDPHMARFPQTGTDAPLLIALGLAGLMSVMALVMLQSRRCS